MTISLKDLAETVRFRTHNLKILGSNPVSLTISNLRILSQVIGKINTHIFNLQTYIQCRIFIIACALTLINQRIVVW